jgi:hypothetical protein
MNPVNASNSPINFGDYFGTPISRSRGTQQHAATAARRTQQLIALQQASANGVTNMHVPYALLMDCS